MGSLGGERVIYSCCTRPPRAPAPVPGTCHPAFWGDSLGILKSWRARPRSAPDASWEGQGPPLLTGHLAILVEEGPLGLVSGQFLAPQADVMGKIGEGRVTASEKRAFPDVSLGVWLKDVWFPFHQSPRIQSWETAPFTLSLRALSCRCCHHKLEPHPRASGKPVGW